VIKYDYKLDKQCFLDRNVSNLTGSSEPCPCAWADNWGIPIENPFKLASSTRSIWCYRSSLSRKRIKRGLTTSRLLRFDQLMSVEILPLNACEGLTKPANAFWVRFGHLTPIKSEPECDNLILFVVHQVTPVKLEPHSHAWIWPSHACWGLITSCFLWRLTSTHQA
jgi:hypothetical protein